MKKDDKEKLRNDAIRIFSNSFDVSPDDAGLHGVITARFGFFSRLIFAIFAEDEETAKAYAKHQDCMHKIWESGIIVMIIAALGLIYAFLQMVQDNMIPLILLAALSIIAAVVYFVMFWWLKPLDKKIHDSEGHLKVMTFYHKKKGGWYKGEWAPEFLAKHIPCDED